MNWFIEAFSAADWPQIRDIYLQGILTGNATFETEAPSWEVWDARHHPFARLAAREADGHILGWTALGPVSVRAVYRGVAEHSIYIRDSARGQGIGRALLETLIAEAEEHGIWTIQTSIFPENMPSLGLHRSCGFREIGRRERIAQLNGVWRDTVLLERRSPLF